MRKKMQLPTFPSLLDIKGKKVVALKGFRTDMRKKKDFEVFYILFDDGETYIELSCQDYFTFHDCDSNAKNIQTFKDKRFWETLMKDENHYPEADRASGWY